MYEQVIQSLRHNVMKYVPKILTDIRYAYFTFSEMF